MPVEAADVTTPDRQGPEIARNLAARLDERDDLAVEWREGDPEPTADGTLAFTVERPGSNEGGDRSLAESYVQPDRVRLEFTAVPDVAAEAATGAGLRVRPKAVRPPRTLAFVEDADKVSSATAVVESVADALGAENP